MFRPLKHSAVILIGFLVVSACGGGSVEPPTQADPANPTATSPATLPADVPTIVPTPESSAVGLDAQSLVLSFQANLEGGWTRQSNSEGPSHAGEPENLSWVVSYSRPGKGGTETLINRVWVFDNVDDSKSYLASQRLDALNNHVRQQSYHSPFDLGTDSFYYRDPIPNTGVVWFRTKNVVSLVSLETANFLIKSQVTDLAAESNRLVNSKAS